MAEIDVEIDELANSIVHQGSGRVFPTIILHWPDLPPDSKSELARWRFNWKRQAQQPGMDVLGILAQGNDTIQGLMALNDTVDHVFVALIESAPHNTGENRLFRGVGGNLFAYACARSFKLGFEGLIAFEAKTELIEHFKMSLGAQRVGSSSRMFVDTPSARNLVSQYQKEEDRWPL